MHLNVNEYRRTTHALHTLPSVSFLESTPSQMGVTLCFLVVWLASLGTGRAANPHILFVVADDLGWNDVGFHNPDMYTPTIDRLARGGVIFNHSYVLPSCTPSRTAFMTGRYPFTVGLQHGVIGPDQPNCVPLNETFLSQVLGLLGYSTHAIGKWHLGFCNWDCTPMSRGFDSFFGFYTDAEDYDLHTNDGYLDYRDNTNVADNYTEDYSTYTFVERAKKIIYNHNQSLPLFLYMPFQNVHVPIQVPLKYEALYPYVKNTGRRRYNGMVTALDEALGNVTEALEEVGMMEDTLILFTTDNGGSLTNYGNNWPLRGGKLSLWEGGTRGVAFMHGWGLQKTGYTYDGLVHAVDWMPTLVTAATGVVVTGIDGMSHWDTILTDGPSKRKDLVYNIDSHPGPAYGYAALRDEKFKLIEGHPGEVDGWYKPFSEKQDTPIIMFTLPNNSMVHNHVQLFNLEDDPCEMHNLAEEMPEVVHRLQEKLNAYKKREVPAHYPPGDPKSDPKKYKNVWSPGWC